MTAVVYEYVRRPSVLTPSEVHQILTKAAVFDGRTVGLGDTAAWHEVAQAQRWTSLPLALAAVTEYYGRPAKQGERLWLMPGHVTDYVRVQARQPAPAGEVLAIGASAPTATESHRAAQLREIAAILARKKSIPDRAESDRVDESAVAKAARERARAVAWERVDSCGACDRQGMRLDRPDVVCAHAAAAAVKDEERLDEAGSSAVDFEVSV